MRESIGATWIFTIVIVFILLFTSYLAISVNYAKAFKIKNHIVTMVEYNEGYSAGLVDKVENYLFTQGYDAHGKVACDARYNENSPESTTWHIKACIGGTGNVSACPASGSSNAQIDCGVAIYEAEAGAEFSDIALDKNNPTCAPRTYYKVVTFFKFDLPIIGAYTRFKVNGETKTIYDFSRATPC